MQFEMKPSRSEFITLRGLRHHVRHWGSADAPKIFMLHGWMDVSASFQFVVDALASDWHVIAPDWRGFGLTQRSHAGSYWFPDYLGDLDALLDCYAPYEPVNLAGHSMGGNIATMYAGIRPARIARLANFEGFGLPPTQPQEAPARYATWLDQLRAPCRMQAYPSLEAVAKRLQKTNPHLDDGRAAFLASHWAAQNADGEWVILGDPAHKRINPVLYRLDEAIACWQAITAPVLWVEAEHTDIWLWTGGRQAMRQELDRRIACIRDVRVEVVRDAGHMLHHDQPQAVADLLERFFR
jgi:pimeloyl-ACP methyl ester carboxylesterase